MMKYLKHCSRPEVALLLAFSVLASGQLWAMGGKSAEESKNTAESKPAEESVVSPGRDRASFDRCVSRITTGVEGFSIDDAADACHFLSEPQVECIVRVGNRDDMNYPLVLKVCREEDPEVVKCAESVGNRDDINFLYALPFCREHSDETISCAGEIGNRDDMNFFRGVPFCVKHYGHHPRRGRSQEKEQLDAAVAAGEADAGVYDHFRNKEGKSHQEALNLAKGPALLQESNAPKFLSKLAQHAYAHDRGYLEAAARMAESQPRFVLLALQPYLASFPYRGVKERFLAGPLAVIDGIPNSADGIERLESKAATRAALHLLVASLQAGQPLMSDRLRRDASTMVAEIGGFVSLPSVTAQKIVELQEALPRWEAVLSSMVENPYLASRARTDLRLIRYLRVL